MRRYALHSWALRLARWAVATSLAVAAPASAVPSFLHPAGPVAAETATIFWIVVAAMVFVIAPVLVLTPVIAWRYRARGGGGVYQPRWETSRWLEALVWSVPVCIVLSLSVVAWTATHRLDPYRGLASTQPPLDVQVVGMDWKWLFLYPEQRVASVNVLVVPAGRPLRLHLTSATVMQSFMVPRLGGQIYAMAGMTTQLNLMADRPGVLMGQNTQYNGDGFPQQRFQLLAVTPAAFDRFAARAAASPRRLDTAGYDTLRMPSAVKQPLLYSGVQPGLFGAILRQGANEGQARR